MADGKPRDLQRSWGSRQVIARVGVTVTFIAFVLWTKSASGLAWSAAVGRDVENLVAVAVLFTLVTLGFLFERVGRRKAVVAEEES